MEAGDPARDLLTTLHAEGAVEEIELDPLDPRETVELAEHLAAGPLDSAEAGCIVAETEGDPLFVVEAIRAGWTSTAGPTPRLRSAVQVRLAWLGHRPASWPRWRP